MIVPGCTAINYPAAGGVVWVRVPGLKRAVKAIAGNDINSRNVTLMGGYAYVGDVAKIKSSQAEKFLKVRPTEETAIAQIAFLYEAVVTGEFPSAYVGGFKPRVPFKFRDIYDEIFESLGFSAQIHWISDNSLIGGVRVNPYFEGFNWRTPAIAVLSSDGALTPFYKDEAFKARPIGYGLWLSVVDFPSLLVTSSGALFRNLAATEPYLQGTASESSDGVRTAVASADGIAKSILIDTIQRKVTAVNIPYTSTSGFTLNEEGTELTGSTVATATGETIILPGVTRPCSFTFSSSSPGSDVSTQVTASVYGTLMINSSKNRAIVLHLNGVYNQDSKWYLFNGNNAIAVNQTPPFDFSLLSGERRLPEIGSYTLTGRDFFTAPALRVSYTGFIVNPIFSTINGTPIVWVTKYENDSSRCRKAFGRVVSTTTNESGTTAVVTGMTVVIDRIMDAEYDRYATYNGCIYSNSGSVLELIKGIGTQNLSTGIVGNGTPAYYGTGVDGAGVEGAGIGFTAFNTLQFTVLGYHWEGDTIYIPNSPPPTPTANAVNWVEVWKIKGTNFVKEDKPLRVDRLPLLASGESFGAVCGAYIPTKK